MAEDKYKTPKDIQEIYDRDRNIHEAGDKLVEEAGELEGQEKVDKLSEAAAKKKKDLENRLVQATGFEVGAGIAIDAVTTPLAALPPVYAGVNFLAGGAINTLAQLWRQDDNFSWGEVAASGAVGVVPGLGGKGLVGVGKAALKGGASGVAHEAIRIGIDEQRLPTAKEAVVGGTIGTVAGGAFKLGYDAVDGLGNRLINDINANPYSKWHPLTGRLGLTQTGTVGAMKTPGYSGNIEIDKRLTTLRPQGPFRFTYGKRAKSAEYTTDPTGNYRVTKEIEADFLAEGARQVDEFTEFYGIKLGKMEIHHKAFLRQLFESINGLDEYNFGRAVKYYERALGFKISFDKGNALAIPEAWHPRLHALINSRIASDSTSWNLKGIEKKFNLSKDWQKNTQYGQRLKIFREISKVINESIRDTDTLYKSIQVKSIKAAKLSKEDFLDLSFDLAELDNKLKGLKSPPLMDKDRFEGLETASDIVNSIVKNSGAIDLTSDGFKKLSVNDTKSVAKVLLQSNGKEALLEAIQTGQSADTILKKNKILFTENRKTWNRILAKLDILDLQRALRGGVSGGRDLSPGMRADD